MQLQNTVVQCKYRVYSIVGRGLQSFFFIISCGL